MLFRSLRAVEALQAQHFPAPLATSAAVHGQLCALLARHERMGGEDAGAMDQSDHAAAEAARAAEKEALAQLALTYEELEADSAQSKGSASELAQVKASEKLYCTSLLTHFQGRQARRDRLVAMLQQIVPKIPDILNLQRGVA